MYELHLMARFGSAGGTGSTDEPLSTVIGEGLTLTDWLVAVGIVAGALILGRVVKSIATKLMNRTDADESVAELVGRTLRNLLALAGLIAAMTYLDLRITPLLGALGIGGLAVAFAAQSILENTFASILLRTRRPIRRGDQVSTNDHDGTVEDVNFRTVVLRTYDGEKVLVPCAMVLGNPIVNHTVNGVRRTTIDLGVAYDSDLERACETLVGSTRAVEGVRASPSPEAFVHEFGDSAIGVALRYWHEPDIATTWRVRSAVAVAAHRALAAAEIQIPFPQRVVTMVREPELADDRG